MSPRPSDLLVVVDLDEKPGIAYMIAPLSANDVIKSLPAGQRRWDDDVHMWAVEPEALPQLTDMLLTAGYLVDIWRGDGDVTMLWPQPRTAASR